MDTDVLIVGAGPAGLAVAACLRRRGIDTIVIDRGTAVGDTWSSRYRRLHLHTPRIQSALPGLRMPRIFGRWVSKDDMAWYLRVYARRHGIAPRFGTELLRLDRVFEGDGGDGRRDHGDSARWRATTSAGEITARHVVIATGYSNDPIAPSWPGADSRPVVHTSAYRDPTPYAGRKVLVVGAGNSGAEIAADLVEGGAAEVRIAIRTPPNIVPRQLGPVPTTLVAVSMDFLPAAVADPTNRLLQRLLVGDLTRYGMPRPAAGVVAQTRATGVTPTIDVGLIAALRAGTVTPVPAVEAFEGGEVVFADGSRWAPDDVIAATGYTTGLTAPLGHLGVLDARGIPHTVGPRPLDGAPGLWFVGLSNPLKGQLFQIRLHSRAVARTISRSLDRARAPR